MSEVGESGKGEWGYVNRRGRERKKRETVSFSYSIETMVVRQTYIVLTARVICYITCFTCFTCFTVLYLFHVDVNHVRYLIYVIDSAKI